MPYSVKVNDPRCKFSSTHFLTDHAKCSRLHGHNWKLSVEIQGDLNDQYFVVDSFDLKQLIMQIADSLDHRLLLPTLNEKIKINTLDGQVKVQMSGKKYEFPEGDVKFLPIKATTAELLSEYIWKQVSEKYPGYKVIVEVSESEGSIAQFTNE